MQQGSPLPGLRQEVLAVELVVVHHLLHDGIERNAFTDDLLEAAGKEVSFPGRPAIDTIDLQETRETITSQHSGRQGKKPRSRDYRSY